MKNINYQSGVEIIDIPSQQGTVQAAILDVDSTMNFFDYFDGPLVTRPVPGYPKLEYVPWGADDKMPYDLQDKIAADEVTSQGMHFNALTCYSGGIEFHDKKTKEISEDEEIEDWAFNNQLPTFFLEQCTDMKYYFFTVSVIILSRDQSRINRIIHKDVCHCRLEKADRYGHINHVFYGDWRNGTPERVEKIPLLDISQPLRDLKVRVGILPGRDGQTKKRTNGCVFAIIRRFPTVGCQYYPIPYYSSIFRSGTYDEKRMISEGIRAKLRNHTSVRYQVEVHRDYWERICEEEDITDDEKRVERIKEEKQKIRDFIAGIHNSGKTWITGFMDDGEGHVIHDIIITAIDTAKEGGDWIAENENSANAISFAMGVHSNLIGTNPGKSQMNNSGSDKRELFTMKQATEKPYHDIMLMPIEMVCRFNKWNVKPVIPFLMLTTLDEHKDAKKVTTENE